MGTTFLPILLQKYLSNPATKALSMSNFKITDLATPTLNSDAATKQYVDNIAGGGGTSTGTLPFLLKRGTGVGAVTIGEFTNPSGDDLQLAAPTTTGKLIFNDIHGVDFTNSPAIFSLPVASTADVVDITNNGTGYALQTNGTKGDIQINGITEQNGRIIQTNSGTNPSISLTHSSGTGNAILVTNNGTGYAISTAGTKGDVQIAGTLEQNGRIIQVSGGGQDSFLLTHPSGVGDGLHIVKNGTTGHALNIDNNGSGNAINATITTATGGILITKNTNSGAGIPLQINHQNNFTSGQSSVVVQHNSNAVAVDISNSGYTGTMNLSQAGYGYGLRVDKSSGGDNGINIINAGEGNALDINRTNSTVAGSGINVLVDGTQSATRAIKAQINSGSATTCEFRQNGSGNAVFIQTTANAGTGLEVLHQGNNSTHGVVIRKEGAGAGSALDIRNLSTGDSLRVADETATDNTMFRIDADGNVGIGVASAVALTNKFESNAADASNTSKISQTTNSLSLQTTDVSSGGSSLINVGPSINYIGGRGSITLEPTRLAGASFSTSRIDIERISTNGVSLNGARGTGATLPFRYALSNGGGSSSSMNVYTENGGATTEGRVKIGDCTPSDVSPSSVLEIARTTTAHSTTIPHILLSGTNATGGVVMNANAGRIENVADPVNAQDAATRAWVLANPPAATSFTLANNASGNANGFTINNISQGTSTGQALCASTLAYTNAANTARTALFRSFRPFLTVPLKVTFFNNVDLPVSTNQVNSCIYLLQNTTLATIDMVNTFASQFGSGTMNEGPVRYRTSASGGTNVGSFEINTAVTGYYQVDIQWMMEASGTSYTLANHATYYTLQSTTVLPLRTHNLSPIGNTVKPYEIASYPCRTTGTTVGLKANTTIITSEQCGGYFTIGIDTALYDTPNVPSAIIPKGELMITFTYLGTRYN